LSDCLQNLPAAKVIKAIQDLSVETESLKVAISA